MELTEREYLSIYNRAYHGHMPVRGGWKHRDAAFSRLMKEARARKSAARTDALPDRCRRERHAVTDRYGETVSVEFRY